MDCVDVEVKSGDLVLPGRLYGEENSRFGCGVVLFHGSTRLGFRYPLIEFLAERLAERYLVLVFDLPGFGRAPELTISCLDDYLMAEHFAAAVGFLRRVAGRVVAVGHSMGGRVAIQGASLYGGVEGLCLLAGLYLFPTDFDVVLGLLRDYSRVIRARWLTSLEEITRQIIRVRPQLSALSRLRVPIFAVQAGGEYYDFIRESCVPAMHASAGPACLVFLEHAHHNFHRHYDEVYQLVSGWINRLFERAL